ncbi:hypothetical protein BY458DRAFT_509523 [Sporodiniella umbellata]|nr:hypothetical protein BY458DRAFT_509523 [Sporodiniella umbellata]
MRSFVSVFRRHFTLMNQQAEIRISSQTIPVYSNLAPKDFACALSFRPFQEWLETLEKQDLHRSEFEFKSIEMQHVDYFGDKVGFIKFKANAQFRETGKSAPGIVFMRGGAVSMLLILKTKGQSDRVILTLQPRIAVPHFSFPELPAGMLDGSGNFAGKAAEEIKEETGLTIEESELVDLTEMAYGNKWCGVYPSAGGSDEFLRLFACVKHMEESEVKKLEGKLTGLRNNGENITLKLVSLENAWKESPDAKLLSSLALYQALKEKINDPK